jgi:subfamily B ATP-binding cassette protein MsbA
MSDLRRLLRYVKPYRKRVALAIASMVGVSLCTGAYMAIVKFIFDDLLVSRGETSIKFTEMLNRLGLNMTEDVRSNLVYILSAFVALAFLKSLFAYFSHYLMGRAGQHVVEDVRNDLYRTYQTQSLSFYHRHPTGNLISHLINDANQVQVAVTGNLISLLQQFLTIMVLFGVMLYYDWALALAVSLGGPVAFALIYRMGKRLKKTSRRTLEQLSGLTMLLQEVLAAVRIVKVFLMETYEVNRFQNMNTHLRRLAVRATRVQSISSPLMEFGGGLLAAGLIWVGHMKISSGVLSTGDLAAFLASMFSIYTPLKHLSNANNQIQTGLASARRLFTMIDSVPSVRERPDAVEIKGVKRGIEFKHAGFQYEGTETQALRDVSFSVASGEAIALVGPSGAGKTTLVNLLPRFYDVTEGSIEIDGRDIRDCTLASLRGRIAIVPQETQLFDDTVANNIRYGRRDAAPHEVEAAARHANAHEFAAELPRGYETMVGENGHLLSGGERQRLAIARALLKNPDILILDEATSDLDARSEAAIRQALERLLKGRTAFVIAHRLSTVLRSDRIMVMDQGRVVAQGTHESLLESSPLYRELYELQFMKEAANA